MGRPSKQRRALTANSNKFWEEKGKKPSLLYEKFESSTCKLVVIALICTKITNKHLLLTIRAFYRRRERRGDGDRRTCVIISLFLLLLFLLRLFPLVLLVSLLLLSCIRPTRW